MSSDQSVQIAERVQEAAAAAQPLAITAGGSRAFYGNRVHGQPLDVRGHRGIVEYEPTELVLTARCGTPLAEIEQTLAGEGQMLAFEPPMFGPESTFGGAIASGISGPRRPFAGAARDFVLGTRIVNGKGEILRFGGQVMKNVAGYDVSRLMAGAQGMLGVLLDISVKVLPRPERELTLAFDCNEGDALLRLRQWIGRGIPISASCFQGERLHIRLSSTEGSVAAAQQRIGGELADSGLWPVLRNQQSELFRQARLWRLSLPPATAPLEADVRLVEWAGAQRWVISEQPLHELAASLGGHATRYDRGGELENRFQPLSPALAALHQRLKQAFDPGQILNPGRLYRAMS